MKIAEKFTAQMPLYSVQKKQIKIRCFKVVLWTFLEHFLIRNFDAPAILLTWTVWDIYVLSFEKAIAAKSLGRPENSSLAKASRMTLSEFKATVRLQQERGHWNTRQKDGVICIHIIYRWVIYTNINAQMYELNWQTDQCQSPFAWVERNHLRLVLFSKFDEVQMWYRR